MEIQRFYLGCLAHASYMISAKGEAAIIDPQRDVGIYVTAAREAGLRIVWVIETHLHADFVSGHVELAHRTGATICMGPGSGADFDHREMHNGDSLPLGDCVLGFLETPGHTQESICISATDPSKPAGPQAIFTGDTLFVGDVGRPDLSETLTPQQLAGLLYDSLHEKLLRLPDSTVVYPAHGAGSLCGKQMSSDSSSTIGRERKGNYALQARSREEFTELLTGDLPPRPAYFRDEVAKNRHGAADLGELPDPPKMRAAQFREAMQHESIVLDCRPPMDFAASHIPGAVNVALSGQFASWAARVLGVGAKVLLVAEGPTPASEARLRLARVGIENVVGVLDGGMVAWGEAGFASEFLPQISPGELMSRMEAGEPGTILDVRERGERADAGAIGDSSISIPLGELPTRYRDIPCDGLLFVHCKGGYRSSIAASLLRRSGFGNAMNLTGGYDGWRIVMAAESMRSAGL
ncbi:MAG TPA: MBL fold metallo-hydrolase [Bryobacteraceae bacterium]|nr:MBL fold metallo-hydrolase [Bryobacteraceae bacterium]